MHLNPAYTFDRYLPSGARAVAPVLCRALAAGVSRRHRCLFLLGPPGSGKTHLLHAIGHAAKRHNASARVVRVSCADLRAGLVEAIRRDSVGALEREYAQADVLLVDDLQELAGRPATQAGVAGVLGACLANGCLVVGAGACRPRILCELTALIPPEHRPRHLVLKRLSPAHVRRILRQEAANWGLSPPQRTVDRIARQCGGDARTALGEFARWHLEQKLSRAAASRSEAAGTVLIG